MFSNLHLLANKFIGLTVRLFCKIYEIVLRVYTYSRRGAKNDPSQILLDCYTEAQQQAQLDLDAVAGVDALAVSAKEILVIIPFKDKWTLTSNCLRALSNQKIPNNWKIRTVLVDNASVEAETLSGIEAAKIKCSHLGLDVLRVDYKFNFSKINNDAFKIFSTPSSDYVLFLNNDVELNDSMIIAEMAKYLDTSKNVGIVGATLLYPDNSIQHLFVAPGVKIIAAHPLKGVTYSPHMAWFNKKARPVAAVTGAVMMLRSQDFMDVGMFDEDLPTLAQDVILNLKIKSKLGKFSAVVGSSHVIHHESMTKRPSFPLAEIDVCYSKYFDLLSSDDFYSKLLSRWSEEPLLAIKAEGRYPVKLVAKCWQ